jgi:hypothetical protein
MRDGECELRPDAVPASVWETGAPAAVLGVLAVAAAGLAASPEYRAPAGLYGVAIRTGDSPEGGEARAVHAADRAGVTYHAEQRGRGGVVSTRVFRPGAGLVVTGSLPGALKVMISALTGAAGQGPEAGI